MKTIKTIEITHEFVKYAPKVDDMQQNVVHISTEFGSTLHKCLCGCNELVVLPINCIIEGKDLGWQMFVHINNKVTFTPSVGNFQLPCTSHYVITKSKANFIQHG